MEQITITDYEKQISQMEFTWVEFNKTKPGLRKVRWQEFKRCFHDHAEYYECPEGCIECGCPYSDEAISSGWCEYANFPCGYNLFLTPRASGMSGMACMGMVPGFDDSVIDFVCEDTA